MKLNKAQLEAVRYYEGDVSGDDPFWGDPKAYVTLNSLFYEGIGTERRRAAEGKYLNPAVIEDPERLVRILADLLSAFRCADLSRERKTYRVERYADFLEMKQAGRTVSFTSTSSGGFLKAYGDRIGIALMEFTIPAGVPCLPFAEVLGGGYLKTEEQEILLPPGLTASFEEVPVNAEERLITDAEGNPPLLKCRAVPGAFIRAADPGGFDPQGPFAGKQVYEALDRGQEPDAEAVRIYTAWKKQVRDHLLHRQSVI